MEWCSSIIINWIFVQNLLNKKSANIQMISLATKWNGVVPSLAAGFWSSTFSMIALQISKQPCSAAQWSGVLPTLSTGYLSSIWLIKNLGIVHSARIYHRYFEFTRKRWTFLHNNYDKKTSLVWTSEMAQWYHIHKIFV